MLKGAGMAKEFGAGRLAAEAERMAEIKARWTPPAEMAEAPVAPAAGAKVLVPEYAIAVGGMRRRVSSHWRQADVFDAMERAALRAFERRQDGVFQPPFTPGQVEMGRHYLVLTERHSAGGMRCAALEPGRAGGDGGGFIDAYLREGDELRLIHARIGAGVALAVRRVRPSKRGGDGAGVISDRVLVDAVCLGGLDLNAVLIKAGWSPDGHHRKTLRLALAAALDRMQGYRGV